MSHTQVSCLQSVKINVSAAVEIVSNLGLWNKFEGGKTVSLAEIVELTKADEIMIGKPIHQLHSAARLF